MEFRPAPYDGEFPTRFRISKPSYRNVLLESILEMCNENGVTPLEIRHPRALNGCEFVDVVFAKGDDVIKIYDNEVSFDFYGTRPELVDRANAIQEHVALCIKPFPPTATQRRVSELCKSMLESTRLDRFSMCIRFTTSRPNASLARCSCYWS